MSFHEVSERRSNDWLLDTGSDKSLTHDFDDFHTYELDHPRTAYATKTAPASKLLRWVMEKC